MNLLLVSNVFPNSAESARGIFTFQIASALQDFCHVRVVAPLPWLPRIVDTRFPKKFAHREVGYEERIKGIKVYHPRYMVIPKVSGFLHAALLSVPLFKTINHIENTWPVDVINAHWIFPDGVAAGWVARKKDKPLVLTALGCDINLYPFLPFRRPQIRSALHAADLITAKSRALCDNILDLDVPDRKIRVIPNGVDLELFRQIPMDRARSILGIPLGKKVILTVGSLDEVKGTSYLVDALGEMRKRGMDVPHLYLIGEGPLKRALLLQANEFGIDGSVVFLGQKPHEEIPLWMNAADVLCLPSIREGAPNVILEALACGTPVVASNVGAIPKMIDRHNGRLARSKDADSLCDELVKCLMHSWDRPSIRRAMKGHSWHDCALAYMDVYTEAIRNSGRSS